MTLSDAIIQSIRQYFEGIEPKETKKSGKSLKYNKKYFDNIEKEFIGKDK